MNPIQPYLPHIFLSDPGSHAVHGRIFASCSFGIMICIYRFHTIMYAFIVFSLLAYPYTQYKFLINAARRLFLARTREKDLLKRTEPKSFKSKFDKHIMEFVDPNHIPSHYDETMTKEILKHKIIHFSAKDRVLLFLVSSLGCSVQRRFCLWRK